MNPSMYKHSTSINKSCFYCSTQLGNHVAYYKGFYSNYQWFEFCSERCKSLFVAEWAVLVCRNKLTQAEKELARLQEQKAYPQIQVTTESKLMVIPAFNNHKQLLKSCLL